MMMMRSIKYALLPALLAGAHIANAQDLPEALSLSNLTVQGTARSMGFGNALGSVGGDFSSISVNPAGLGVYRSSELLFTPSLRMNGTSSQFLGTATTDNSTRFNINNFGLVATKAPKGQRYEKAAWKSVSFAFGMNRVADFNYSYNYTGKNNTGSGSQVFESAVNADTASAFYGPSNALGYMGYQTYLLNPTSNGYFTSIVPFTGGVNQTKRVQSNGGISEYVLALGGNYKEKLMLGITLGISNIKMNQTTNYSESLAAGNNAPNPSGFRSFSYNQVLDISGTGINAKLGAIYKINDAFRVGAAFHTPQVYYINDVYTPTMNTVHNDSSVTLTISDYLIQSNTNYRLTTPWRAVLSATYIIKKLGFITADYEYVGYNSMKYRFLPDDMGYLDLDMQAAINQALRNTYQSTSNFRIGAEGRLGKFFMLRAGFGYYGNPYKTGNDNASRMDISGGLGFRFKHFFTDLGYVYSMYQLAEQPYRVDYSYVQSGPKVQVPTATTDFSMSNIALTIGVKF